MMLLPIYAMLVWFFCFRHRRRLLGWGCLALGILGIATLSLIDRRIRAWNAGESGGESAAFTSLQFVLYGEIIIVALGGIFILLLKRNDVHVPCRKCGYELKGLEEPNPKCPECGLDAAAHKASSS